MSDGFLIAVIGVLSAILGGAIQAWSSRRFEVSRFERQNRHDAYLAFFNGVSRLSFAEDDNDAHLAALALIAEARSRIALCGSPEVISHMVRVFENGSDVRSEKAQRDITNLVAAMRADSLSQPGVAERGELYVMTYGVASKGIQ